MTEERSKRREFLPLVFIVNCFKKPILIRIVCKPLAIQFYTVVELLINHLSIEKKILSFAADTLVNSVSPQ